MGSAPASIVCAGCGEREIPARAQFCHICGTPLSRGDASPSAAEAPAVQPVATADTIASGPKGREPVAAAAVTGSGSAADAASSIPATIAASDAPTHVAAASAAAASARGGGVGAEDDPLVGQTISGRFRVTERLGAGGMGTVYLAEQIAMKRQVVLKFLHQRMSGDAEMTKRFEREALAVSQLSCANTVIIHDYGQAEDGRFFMAMEYLAGQTLGHLLRRMGALPPLRAIAIVLQVLESLAEAHEKGMVHRDLKPDNIMLVQRGGSSDVVKVLDFGIVKMLGDDGAPSEASVAAAVGKRPDQSAADIAVDDLTREGDVFGSPKYMAPEQILGEAIDLRADIYAIGVILFEMLSGEPPYSADSLLGLFTQQTTGRVPRLKVGDIPEPKLEALVQRCLARRREDRPADAAALAAELRTLLPTLVKRQEQAERRLLELAGVKPRWPPLLVVAVGLGVAVVALGVMLLVRGGGGDDDDGHALAPGERVFIGAASERIPPWIDRPDERDGGTLGVVRNVGRRKDALILASAHAIGRLVDIPARWSEKRQRAQYLSDLSKIYERLVMLDASLRPTMRTYWIKLRGAKRSVYDGYALAKRPADLARLRRAFAEMRYRRFNLLLDDAVRGKKCERARRLARTIEGAIGDLEAKPKRKKSMRFHLGRALGSCRPVKKEQ